MTKVNIILLSAKVFLLDIGNDLQVSANTVLVVFLIIIISFVYGMIKSPEFREMVSFFFAGARIERVLREQVTNAQINAQNAAVANEFGKVLSGELIVTKSAEWWIKRQDDVNLPLKVGDYRLKGLPTGVNEYPENDNFSVNNRGINTVNEPIYAVNAVNSGNMNTSDAVGDREEEERLLKMSTEINKRTEVFLGDTSKQNYIFKSYPYGLMLVCRRTGKTLVTYPIEDFDQDNGVYEMKEYGIIFRTCEGDEDTYCERIIVADNPQRKKCKRCAALSEGKETSFIDAEGQPKSYAPKENSFHKIDNSCEGFSAKMAQSKGKDCVVISANNNDKYLILVESITETGVFLQTDKISVRKCKNPKCNKIIVTHNANKSSCSQSCKTTASKLKNAN